jgi:DNA-binding winged helix-turn-helix (wHTH) protein
MTGSMSFEGFVLDPRQRRLSRHGAPIEVNSRYFDGLALLVSERGSLVTKERFLDEVWRGVPVTDEALTQCIKTLRKQLGDDAANPRFIETVPKHGYRFIARVEEAGTPASYAKFDWRQFFTTAAAGTVGGGMAGFFGGLFYGLAGASQPLQPGMGAVSVLLVLLCVTILVALIGALGVSLGIAAAGFAGNGYWKIVGGAVGGAIVGAATKLLGLDAFSLLLGQSLGDITGGTEGAVLGAAVGLGAWLAGQGSLRRGIAIAAIVGGVAGTVIILLGGQLMGGSLDLLARQFPDSRLRLDQVGALLGEPSFGAVSQAVTGGLEGGLFAAGVVGAILLARRG